MVVSECESDFSVNMYCKSVNAIFPDEQIDETWHNQVE